ncbi:MAG: site-specific DNA-methyltransferase [Chlorobi bacterium]|nr:site-specific DNA-methyltransferase [Chlorobiota bacterium]MCI0714981.1 site-specific DNA-methyltransferase [Chlorobiota bacterium]
MAKKKIEEPQITLIEKDNGDVEIPKQKEFYEIPARFGSVPVDEAPLGYEVETRRRETKITKFEHAYPKIYLPFQEVERVSFGHGDKFEKTELFPKGANRLFFGDCLHIMRQLPSKSIDLIYIDPPFFSGRNYNVIFGDKNEMRSFTDIWEGGMPGYLVWLNVRLYEMKRLLKDTGSIYVHLDWHASHYVKVEMDKIFGYDNFVNEIVWWYRRWSNASKNYQRMHDVILFYKKSDNYKFNIQYQEYAKPEVIEQTVRGVIEGKLVRLRDEKGDYIKREKENKGVQCHDVFDIQHVQPTAKERIGYPTQKPEKLLERIIIGGTDENDVVADFFCGGGTTPTVAQKLNRRWVACDQSRIAVSITADRINKLVSAKGRMFDVPDYTIEHWGIYEAPMLEKYNEKEFKEFVIKAFGGKTESVSPYIHGVRHGVPLYVGEPSRNSKITKEDVKVFAEAIFKERNSNYGTMIAWNFDREAKRAADILSARENIRMDFVRLNLIRLEDEEFRQHVVSKHKDYEELLTFIQPPEIRINYTRLSKLVYKFDVSESVSLNKDGIIANVQWDFNFKHRFKSTDGYAFLRDKKTGKPILIVDYEFKAPGNYKVGCSVQDDQGGEKTEIMILEVK